MGVVIGVDEAGRGPVLGSMFVAGVKLSDGGTLPDGIRDSKQLSSGRRAALAAALRDHPHVDSSVVEVDARTIDENTGRLNQLTASAAASAIDRLEETRPRAAEILVDSCDTSPDRHASRVCQALSADNAVIAAHGAEDRYPVVAAASIIAKDRREDHVEALRRDYGPVGSGYPSDPTTRSFLRHHLDEQGELPPCARRTWGTCTDLLAAARQGTLDDF